jgi:hypothetical protein
MLRPAAVTFHFGSLAFSRTIANTLVGRIASP